MTSVLGHLLTLDFGKEFSNWNNASIPGLFEAPINSEISEGMHGVAENLRALSKISCKLVLWTDCDREGEHIGSEIERICLGANPKLDVFRARYSVVSHRDVNLAFQNLDRLDRGQIDAVSCRQEIDLRSGATLTRLQSLYFQQRFPLLKGVISYGSCQFPTLGFVVEQYLKLMNFLSNKYWTLKLKLEIENFPAVIFNWCRGRVFDRFSCSILYAKCNLSDIAIVRKVLSKPSSRWKPLPLRTVEFQKKAAKSLKMSSDTLMHIAENLYNRGYISYPRTETDQFDKKFDHKSLIALQQNHPSWGTFAQDLLQRGSYCSPRSGKNNDNAHPPIHPTKPGVDLSGDEVKIYEFITRSYLAACSHDARAMKTFVFLGFGNEQFQVQGTSVTDRNYLDVYPYEFWNDKLLPQLFEGQMIKPTEFLMESGTTSPPQLLSESDLIGTMDKNRIGTDATIHEHIKKIIDRKYVKKLKDSRFVPTILGLSLVQGYDQVGVDFSLSKPRLRAIMEADLAAICEHKIDKLIVLEKLIKLYSEAFYQVRQNMDRLFLVLHDNLGNGDDPFHSAPLPEISRSLERFLPENKQDRSILNAAVDEGRTPGPNCSCGKPTIPKRTLKPGQNQGRIFYSCSICNFFKWMDHEQENLHSPELVEDTPLCICSKPSARRTVNKSGSNRGKDFYCCSSQPPSKCDFFIWCDFEDIVNEDRDSAIQRCLCDLIALKDTIKSGDDQGKVFYRCSKQVKRCTYFQWSDHSGTPSLATSRGDGSIPRCFKCGEEGHYATTCVKSSTSRSRGRRGRGRGKIFK